MRVTVPIAFVESLVFSVLLFEFKGLKRDKTDGLSEDMFEKHSVHEGRKRLRKMTTMSNASRQKCSKFYHQSKLDFFAQRFYHCGHLIRFRSTC